MKTEQSQEVVTHLLRISVIAIRNLAALPRRSSRHELALLEWAEFCHSLPSLLLGGCKDEFVGYFITGHAATFLQNFPDQTAADFLQARGLLDELSALSRATDQKK